MANLRTNNLSGEQGQNAYRGSVFFNDDGGGNGSDSLTVPAGSDFAYGTGDFTFEAYVWISRYSGGTRLIFSQTVSGNNYILFGVTSSGQVTTILGHSNQVTSTETIAENSWNHVAVSRASGTVKVFVNGDASSGSSITTDLNDTTRIPTIGKYTHSTQLQWKGYISNFRITKGEALYTADFIPPTTELTADANTVLLCCQNSDDVTQEATGKTITGNGNLATAGYNKTQPKVIPPFGVDAGNTFGGPIQQSTQGYMYFQSGRTEERGGTRALMIGGFSPGGSDTINFVNVATEGTALDFGNLSRSAGYCGAMGGRTRGVIPLQYQMTPSEATTNIIEFLTILTEGNTQDFGDMATSTYGRASASNDVRGIISGGEATEDAMEFITLASLGNGSSFGDLTQGRREPQSTADPTRMVTAGGYASPSTGTRYNIIDFVTIATTGNAQDFGDLTVTRWKPAACADATRGVFAGGGTPSNLNVIDFITIQSTGDATDFGDLVLTSNRGSAGSDSIRGVIFTGFSDTGSHTANIDSIIIQTTGSAKRFGETTTDTHSTGGLSNGHGGLS